MTIPETTTTNQSQSNDFELYNPSSVWITRWWKWVLETPASKSPIDAYSRHYEKPWQNQPYDKSSDVWFLAGAFNDGKSPEGSHNITYRSIVGMPNNKSLLLPVLNYFALSRGLRDIQALEEKVQAEMDIINPESLYVTIDGKQIHNLQQYRCDTGLPFEITVDGTDNIVKLRHIRGKKIKLWAKGDGYWLFLKPLAPGDHDIHSFGSCRAGKIQIEVHYQLDVLGD